MPKDRKRKIVYVGFAFSHHKNTYAGYNRIKEYLDYDYVIDIQQYFDTPDVRSRLLRRIINIWHSILCKCLDLNCLTLGVVKLIYLAIFKGSLIIHFVHGENFFPIKLLNYIHRNNRFVFTFHQPFSWFEQNKFFENRKQLCDGIILMSNNEISRFVEASGCKSTVFIPHGITTDFFNCAPVVGGERIVLTVGSWLRDFSFACSVYNQILAVDPSVKIVVVSNRDNAHYFAGDNRISFFHNISNEQLIDLYQKCSVLFLPLSRFTANNTLLESGACGCNIVISTNYESDNTYFPREMVKIVPMDRDITSQTIIETLASPGRNITLANYVQERYSWQIVADETKRFLCKIS